MKNRLKKVYGSFAALLRREFVMIGRNVITLLLFSVLSTLVIGFTMITVKALALDLSFALTGVDYVSPDNILQFILSPATLIFFILSFFLVGYAMMFEISGLLYIFRCSRDGVKAGFINTLLSATTDCNRLAKPKNFPLLLVNLLFVPFSAVMPLSVVGIAVGIPEFIRDFIVANSALKILYYGVIMLLIFLSVSFIFVFPGFIFRKEDFGKSIKSAKKLIKKRGMKTLFAFLGTSFVFSGIIFLFSVGVFSLWAFILATVNFTTLTGTLISQYSGYITLLFTALDCVFMPVFMCGLLSCLYFRFSENEGMPQMEPVEKVRFRKVKLVSLCVAVALILPTFLYSQIPVDGGFFEKSERCAVAAHRGDSVRAPENSMAAFELAISESAQMLELDIYQTKDRQLVVCHDDNLLRVTGQDVYVHDLTVAEIQSYDAGSWFSEKYSYIRIPTLEEVLNLIKGKFETVQIEIKYTGYEEGLEEELIRLINKYEMRDEVSVISLNSVPLERIKELDSGINTAYCMFLAWGDINNIAFSDDFSIEEENVEPLIISKIHREGKKVYAWTCNDADNVQWLLDCGVDGILTDDPIMLNEALDKCDYSGGFARMLRIFFYEIKYGV